MTAQTIIPARAGVGLKAQHYATILEEAPDLGWFEVHPENYMGDGGPPHAALTAIRRDYPLSLHGVGLSLGGHGPLDEDHINRLKALVDRYEPGLVSEHLAWSSLDGVFFNDLLPLPYTGESLARVCAHVDHLQSRLGRRILLENPATYVTFATSTIAETEFLTTVAKRTGCGLLLDVNNVYVSAVNHGFEPLDYLAAFPLDAVGEIHLAGHAEEREADGGRLLIDAHDRPVADPVWQIFEAVLSRAGVRPTLIEWDNDLPEWPVLFAEARAAGRLLSAWMSSPPEECRHATAG